MASTTPAPGPTAWTPISSPKRDNTTPSCAVCRRRKVKCNRTYPCAPCLKTGLECSFRPTNQHRAKRRKRSTSIQDETRTSPRTSTPIPSTTSRHQHQYRLPESLPPASSNIARLVAYSGGYRYVNNSLRHTLPTQSTLGANPGETTATVMPIPSTQPTPSREPHRSLETGYGKTSLMPSAHFIFNQRQQPVEQALPPLSPGHIVQLWQIYLANIDLMMKVFHAPTVQKIALGQIGAARVPPNEQVLVSAVYFISCVSLTDHECWAALQQTRSNALSRFRQDTETALSAVGFVTTTDLTVLQGMVLYLAALRSLGDVATVWSLLGLTIRIAGTQGLAHDGSLSNLSPFEAELRRRLWWAIVYMDARISELVGQDGDLLMMQHDVNRPSNLNDTDLFPNMQRLPESKSASTEMLYVQFQAMILSAMHALPGGQGPGGIWKKLQDPSVPLAEKIDMIKVLEGRSSDEILAGCDPGVPLQLLTMNSANQLFNKMRLVAHVSLTYANKQWSAPYAKFSEPIFKYSMILTQLQLDLWSESCLQRWRWHWQGHFQWFALTCLIRQTRFRESGTQTTRAWAMIRKVFDAILPQLELSEKKSPLVVGVQSLLHAAQISTARPKSMENCRQSTPLPMKTGGPGSRPHNALLPGMMERTPWATPPGAESQVITPEEPEDANLDFNFESVDWAEFDRLVTELCEQEN